MIKIKIPYGKRFLKFSLPPDKLLGVLENKNFYHDSKSVRTLVSESLGNVLCKKRLKDLSSKAKRILVVVPDATRSAHLKEVLPYLLKRIGKYASSIDIIIATGLHKKHTTRQLKNLLGKSILSKYRIIQHEHNKASLASFGSTFNAVPIVLNKNLTKYDTVISIGVIEPHLYAGYSGGAKTIAIGLAGEKTINATHGVTFLDNDLTRLGSIKNNPFQKSLWNIVKDISVGLAVNIVNDLEGKAIKVFSGDIKKVFTNGAAFAKKVFALKVSRPSDIVICGVGYPKDVNLYQASRAINYIVNVDKPILKRGGILMVVAELCDGAGDGLSERRFYNELKNMINPKTFVERIRRTGSCIAGVHRAYMVAKALLYYKVVFVSTSNKKCMEGVPFLYFKNIDDALLYADKIIGERSKIYVVPHALSTICTSITLN